MNDISGPGLGAGSWGFAIAPSGILVHPDTTIRVHSTLANHRLPIESLVFGVGVRPRRYSGPMYSSRRMFRAIFICKGIIDRNVLFVEVFNAKACRRISAGLRNQ
jgi:hypothetical protein